jgi:hypothetical protein
MSRASPQQRLASALHGPLAALCCFLAGCTRSASLDALAVENAKVKAENGLLKAENLKLSGELDRTKEALADAIKAIEQRAQRDACVENMRKIGTAVSYWALENRKKDADLPTATELSEHVKLDALICPACGHYSLGTVGTFPSCTIHGGMIQDK